MNTLVHADVFFFVSTIALIVITILLVVALIFFVKILKDISEISSNVKKESIEIIEDVKQLRGDIKQEGFKLTKLATFFGRMFFKKRKSARDHEE